MIAEFIISQVTSVINYLGYFGVFILMAIESTIFPLPSEAVMPFVGFLVASGKFNLYLSIFSSALGCLAGSLVSYYIGYYGGMPFIRKFGRYFLLDDIHMIKAKKWFKKRGALTIFIGRFIPEIRHVISIPAGFGKMDLLSFSVFTFIGAGIWNSLLIWIGYSLEKNWKLFYHYAQYIDAFVVIIVGLVLIYYFVNIVDSYSRKN